MRHPIHILWSHPRSMSTAIERVMRERGDMDCAHEPFMYDYYVHRRVARMPFFDVDPDHPVSYEAIRDWLIERAETRPVFAKDMAYYVLPHLLEDPFCERITHSFLIRDPVSSILSYYRLDPELTCDEVGIEAQWSLFSVLRERAGTPPPVIEAEAVQRDARAVLGAWWSRIGLENASHAFDWDAGEGPKDWHQVEGWHEDVQTSRAIRSASVGSEEKLIEFEKAAAAQPRLTAYLDHHRPFYERLREFSVSRPGSADL